MDPEFLAKLKMFYGTLKAIIYIRVSEEREEMYSPAEQYADCMEFCKKWGIVVIDVVQDLDLSGGTFAGRKVTGIIERVRSAEANIALVAKRDRWGRDPHFNEAYERSLQSAGGILIAAKNPVDPTTYAGQQQIDTDNFISKIQRNSIAEHWRNTQKRRWKADMPLTGRPQFGYQRCPECQENVVIQTMHDGKIKRSYPACKSCEGFLKKEPLRGVPLMEFYKRWMGWDQSKPESTRSLIVEMRERGVVSVRGNVMGESNWFATLDTGFAFGWLRRRSIPTKGRGLSKKWTTNKPDTFDIWKMGKHEKWSDDMDLWEAYKERRCAPSDRVVVLFNGKHKYELSGNLVCGLPNENRPEGICGTGMYADKAGKDHTPIYVCQGRREKTCKGLSITQHRAHKLVLDWVVKMGADKEVAEAAMKDAARTKEAQTVLEAVADQISTWEKKLSRLTDLQVEGEIHPATFKLKETEYLAELDPLRARADLLRQQIRPTAPVERRRFLEIASTWDKMTPDERRFVLDPLIHQIVVTRNPERNRDNTLRVIPVWEAPVPKKGEEPGKSGVA
ncbi:recombinase family protein [Streptomyces sp. NPDC005047]